MACGCGSCTLLPDGVAPFYSPELRVRTRMGPILLGLYTRERWDDHAKLFIFQCRSCHQVRYSFPCYSSLNWFAIPHFHCDWCADGLAIIIDAQVYAELGIDDPPGGWRHFIEQAAQILTGYPPPCTRRAGSHP